MVLMAIVDANYEFLLVDFGTNGRISNGGVLQNTKFFEMLQDNKLELPNAEVIKNSSTNLPYVFVADDAFPLRTDMLKPFRQADLHSRERKIFNYRLSRARHIVENAFGILASRFRIYHTAINLEPKNIEKIVMATCVLHNYLIKHVGGSYAPRECFYEENTANGTIITEGYNTTDSNMENLHRTQGNILNYAKQVRAKFTNYFVNEGKVSWQDNFVRIRRRRATSLIAASRNQRKRKWVHEINTRREEHGEYHRLCRELESHEDRFYTYFRMSRSSFEELYNILKPKIEKLDTNWRRAIGPRERLAICLRFLATGDSYQTIAFSFRVGRSTVGSIVKNVCTEIWNSLQPIYMPTPTESIWRQAETGYREIWNFPNCLGSIDGKHVAIKCPRNSGSNFFCYKNFFSIVLLAIVDPFYKFIVVDIGSCGRFSDSGIFENSTFYREFIVGKTLLPPKPLPAMNEPIPHVLIGDEGFALKPYLMRPFPKAAALQDERKRNYNKRLCRARRVVENAFGILGEKWRVLHRPIDCSVDTADDIVKATCCLHNYVRTKEGRFIEEESTTTPAPALQSIRPTNQRSSNAAFQIREKFVSYFNQNII
ncbi:hypothetical protein evm_010953 [Chilo suppressalis]|nr:hypothetical protein evm_010953 [Chilo suppressalis]